MMSSGTQPRDEATRRSNVRLAVVLALIALGFYLGMIYFGGQ